jgi:hypothetical protein
LYRDDHYEYVNGSLSIKQPPVSQAAKEKAMKNRAARGSEVENDKAPCTSKFHFSKGKYGHIVHAWHGVLIQKAEANLLDICAQARKIIGAMDFGMGIGNQLVVDPEIRARVGLDSEPESDSEGNDEDNAGDDNDGDDEHQGDNDDSVAAASA